MPLTTQVERNIIFSTKRDILWISANMFSMSILNWKSEDKMNKIVKAEILWSRNCGLTCPYCAMVTEEKVDKDLLLWQKGVQQLKKLDCSFCAIYGAEPLDDFAKLPEFIAMLSAADILNTLITNGCSPNTKEKITELHSVGLRSLTTSYDGEGEDIVDRSSRAKTDRGIKLLRWFRDTFPDIRDVAAVSTINRKNFRSIPRIIEKMTKEGIWMLFDLIHPDRGQPGSKCQNTKLTEELLFQEEDIPELLQVLVQMSKMKKTHLVHWSDLLVDYIIANEEVVLNYDWHCVEKDVFPSWITVENTGEVYCCDDFHVTNEDRERYYLWEIADKWNQFSTYQAKMAKKYCSGCIWNTHWDANAIKRGDIPVGNYVHNLKTN